MNKVVSDINKLVFDALGKVTHSVGASLTWFEDGRRKFQDYASSEEFEKDLDALAERLGIRDPEFFSTEGDVKERKARKLSYLYKKYLTDVTEIATASTFVTSIVGPKRAAKAAFFLSALAKTGFVGFQVYQVYASKKAEVIEIKGSSKSFAESESSPR